MYLIRYQVRVIDQDTNRYHDLAGKKVQNELSFLSLKNGRLFDKYDVFKVILIVEN